MNKIFVEFYIANKIYRQGLHPRGFPPPLIKPTAVAEHLPPPPKNPAAAAEHLPPPPKTPSPPQ
jgi:hypothetical protein